MDWVVLGIFYLFRGNKKLTLSVWFFFSFTRKNKISRASQVSKKFLFLIHSFSRFIFIHF